MALLFDIKGIGKCLLASTIRANVSPASMPAAFWDPISVNVVIAAQDPTAASEKSPSGTVQVSMAGNHCTAVLDSTGAGVCTLPASPSGTAALITTTYSGDESFDPATDQTSLEVARANTLTGMSAIPHTTTSGLLFRSVRLWRPIRTVEVDTVASFSKATF